MTLAWYGHLRFKEVPLVVVIFAAWAIALVEYCMAVPANRWGSAVYTTIQREQLGGTTPQSSHHVSDVAAVTVIIGPAGRPRG